LPVLVGTLLVMLTAAGETDLARPSVKLGIEVLAEKNSALLRGKKIGLVTNVTGVDGKLRSSVDIIHSIPDIKLTALFAPEHGIRGGIMGFVENGRDEKTGVKVFSLHGSTRRPTEEMFKDVEILMFDMQDIGARSYTYISTMKNCMEEAAKRSIHFIVLDRPNPLGGLTVDGPVLDMNFMSFIGAGPLAYVHGMTIGEIARFFNSELKINCNLTVIKMEGWNRGMLWDDTGLIWVPTSPHIPEPDTPFFYPLTGILGELGLVNVGVGYTLPFKIVGAPWMDSEKIVQILNDKKLPGVYFQPFHFKPFYAKYKDEFCNGFKIIITDKKSLKPLTTGYFIIETLLATHPGKFNFKLPSKTIWTCLTRQTELI